MSGMKTGEIDYLKNLGWQGSKDAFDKPFSLCLAAYGALNPDDGAICMLQK